LNFLKFLDKFVNKVNVNFLAKFEEIFVINKMEMGKKRIRKGEGYRGQEGATRQQRW